jgi:hypothetical protein
MPGARETSATSSAREPAPNASPRCVLNARVSGAFVEDERGAMRVDYACVCAVDNLVSASTREALFARVGGDETTPSERAWTENFKDHDGETSRTHGLVDDVLDELANEAYAGVGAIGDVMRRVRETFKEYDVSVARTDMFSKRGYDDKDAATRDAQAPARRAHVCANAVRHTDRFSYHRDVDVRGVEFSGELADVGRFAGRNRDPNKPRFVTIIVYLNPQWTVDDEGETLFVDEDTGVGVVIVPKPGRVVFMDADVFHSLKQTRRKVRYSLVIHTLFTARADAGVMARELARPEWGTPAHVGSAARLMELIKATSTKRARADGDEPSGREASQTQ